MVGGLVVGGGLVVRIGLVVGDSAVAVIATGGVLNGLIMSSYVCVGLRVRE